MCSIQGKSDLYPIPVTIKFKKIGINLLVDRLNIAQLTLRRHIHDNKRPIEARISFDDY